MLQKLGLKHGDVMNARELYQLIFERANRDDFYFWGAKPGSLWHDGDPDTDHPYAKGREMLIKELDLGQKLS